MIWHNKNCTPTFEQDEVSLIVWRDSGGKRLIEWIPYCPLRDGDWERFVYDFRILYWSYEKDLLDQAEADGLESPKTNFTPGPWTVGGPTSIESTYPIFWSPDGEQVCDVVYNMADAVLIASAPELYNALVKAAFEYCKGCRQGFSSPDSFLVAGCPGKDGYCPAVFWWELLRKAGSVK